MLSVIMLSVVMLSAAMLNVIMLSVVAPKKESNSNERNFTVFNGSKQKKICIQFHAKLVILVRVYEVFISISLLTEMHKMKKKKIISIMHLSLATVAAGFEPSTLE